MYRYDAFDQALVDERVAQFRDQVQRRLSGALSEDAFQPLRLMNGVYLELHSYLLRVAIPYGTLGAAQLRALAAVARRYDRGYGHFTTRQNVQFNWMALAEIPDALADLAKVGLHAMQTSGACIRNVTTDPWAGVAADEGADPRPTCEIIRQWSTQHPEFTYLPRKFKIAVTGAPTDRAAIRVHDIGLRLVEDPEEGPGYEVFVGGGLGRTPVIGQQLRAFLPQRHLLSYLEAILRVYNLLGRRDNKYKARIKILVTEMGLEAFRERVEAEWQALKGGPLTLTPDTLAFFTQAFPPPPALDDPRRLEDLDPATLDALESDPAFALWVKANVVAHKVAGYGVVNIPLKAGETAPGDATASQMEYVAEVAERFTGGEIRVTHEQNLVLPSVRLADLGRVWRVLAPVGLARPVLGLITDIIACPGLDYCALSNARSIPLAQALARRFADTALAHAIGPITLNVSGCINACAHHHIGNIGVLGVDRQGEEAYQIVLGGAAGNTPALARPLGPAVPAEAVVEQIHTLIQTSLTLRQPGETFIDTVHRVGFETFRESLYAAV